MPDVRPFAVTDREFLFRAVCDLEQVDFSMQDFEQQFLQALQASNLKYFIAHEEEQPIGYFALRIENQLHHCALVAEIVEFYIVPQHRNRGLGTALLQVAVDRAKQFGAILIEVASSVTRHDTHRFYEKFGFAKTHYRFAYTL